MVVFAKTELRTNINKVIWFIIYLEFGYVYYEFYYMLLGNYNVYVRNHNLEFNYFLGLAWIIIPLTFSLEVYGYIFNSWRLFLLLTGVSSLIISLIGINYPESPKFLLAKGKSEEALNVLRKIYAVNTGHKECEYPVRIIFNII